MASTENKESNKNLVLLLLVVVHRRGFQVGLFILPASQKTSGREKLTEVEEVEMNQQQQQTSKADTKKKNNGLASPR